MNWVHTHLYSVVCGAIGLLAILVIIVAIQSPRSPATGNLTAWGGSGVSSLDPTSYSPQSQSSETTPLVTLGGQNPSFGVIPPRPFSADGSIETTYDIGDLISLLSIKGSTASNGQATTPSGSYTFIPTGLISTSTFGKVRTTRQQSLYEYGNSIGAEIQSYESAHRDTTQILKNQVEDRTNAQKNEAVRDIGASLVVLGEKIAGIEVVPTDVAGMHRAIAASYKEMGSLLANIPSAERDEAYVKAITEYNASADTFSANFVALATLFSVSGVTFDSSDSGNVFTFVGNGSL